MNFIRQRNERINNYVESLTYIQRNKNKQND